MDTKIIETEIKSLHNLKKRLARIANRDDVQPVVKEQAKTMHKIANVWLKTLIELLRK